MWRHSLFLSLSLSAENVYFSDCKKYDNLCTPFVLYTCIGPPITVTASESDDKNASSEAANEEIKYTPAMTSLKRVANYGPEKPKSVSPVAGRPLPSVPHRGGSHTTVQPPTLPLRDNERGLPTSLASPMVHLSPNSSTAKFLAHPNHSQGSSSALSSATKEAPTSSHDPLYADPDELVFSKPSQSQQQTIQVAYLSMDKSIRMWVNQMYLELH